MPNLSSLLFYTLDSSKKSLARVSEQGYSAQDDLTPHDLRHIINQLTQCGYFATCPEKNIDEPMIFLTYNSSSSTPAINAWSREKTTNQVTNQENSYSPAGPSSLLYPAAILYALQDKGGPFKNAYKESPRLSLTQETYQDIWNFYLEVSKDGKWDDSPLREIYKEFNPATTQPQSVKEAQGAAKKINEEVMARVLFRLVSAKYQTVYLDGRAIKKNPKSKADIGKKTSAEIIQGIGKEKSLESDWHKHHLTLEEIELAARINLVARVNASDYGSREISLPGKPEDFLGELERKKQSTQRALIYVCAPEMREGASHALERNQLDEVRILL